MKFAKQILFLFLLVIVGLFAAKRKHEGDNGGYEHVRKYMRIENLLQQEALVADFLSLPKEIQVVIFTDYFNQAESVDDLINRIATIRLLNLELYSLIIDNQRIFLNNLWATFLAHVENMYVPEEAGYMQGDNEIILLTNLNKFLTMLAIDDEETLQNILRNRLGFDENIIFSLLRQGDKVSLELLRRAGFNFNHRNHHQQTTLLFLIAEMIFDEDIILWLLENELVDIDAQVDSRKTYTGMACTR